MVMTKEKAMTAPIVLAVDGSPSSRRAVEWCAAYAARMGADVTVVHAIELPVYGTSISPYVPIPYPTAEQRDELADVIARDWCKPLADAGIAYRVVLADAPAGRAIVSQATAEDASLVVVGRRGRGAFTEFILGSTSHMVALHAGRPLVIVP
jgi:nucleotide-binding universal stress UspA family protein